MTSILFLLEWAIARLCILPGFIRGVSRHLAILRCIRVLLGIGVSVSLTACIGSTQTRFYTLSFEPFLSDCKTRQQSVSEDTPSKQAVWDIDLAPVDVPTEVARPQIVLTSAPGERVIKEHVRWAAPLQDEIHLALQQALSGSQRVAICKGKSAAEAQVPIAAHSPKNNYPQYRLTVQIQRFNSTLSKPGDVPGYASMRAVWQISWIKYKIPRGGSVLNPQASRKRYSIKGVSDFTETFTQPGYPALALAHQHLIEHLARDVLSVISNTEMGQSRVEQNPTA